MTLKSYITGYTSFKKDTLLDLHFCLKYVNGHLLKYVIVSNGCESSLYN